MGFLVKSFLFLFVIFLSSPAFSDQPAKKLQPQKEQVQKKPRSDWRFVPENSEEGRRLKIIVECQKYFQHGTAFKDKDLLKKCEAIGWAPVRNL